MTRARPVFKCPLCGELAPLSALYADDRGVEMTCSGCENSVRFKTFSDVEAGRSKKSGSSSLADFDSDPDSDPDSDSNPKSVPATEADVDPKNRAENEHENKSEKVADIDRSLIALLEHIPELDAQLATAYRQVVTTGDRLEEHKNLAKRAAVLDQLKELGRLYKLRLEQNPDDAVAKACQEQIIVLAITKLKPRSVTMEHKADKSRQAVIITLSLLVIVAAIAWMLHQGLF